jgi:hypothetical protein
MATPESKVKDGVKKVLKAWGLWYYMPVQNGMGVVGIPDIVGCRPVVITADMVGRTMGQFFAIETKAPGKRSNTTANQDRVLMDINLHNGIAIVVDDPRQLVIHFPEEALNGNKINP